MTGRGRWVIGGLRKRVMLAVVLTAWALTACGGVERFEYHSDREVKQGPGLFTGKAGSVVIYRK